MAWFDGTSVTNMEIIKEGYPIEVTKNVWTNEGEKGFTIINDFEEGTPFYNFADPKMEFDSPDIFYHVFEGEDAKEIADFIIEFIANYNDDGRNIELVRKEDKMFSYANGLLLSELLLKQDELKKQLLNGEVKNNIFILPFRIYKHKCFVCGHRTMTYGIASICIECGCDPLDTCTLENERKAYFAKKRANFNYNWEKSINEK